MDESFSLSMIVSLMLNAWSMLGMSTPLQKKNEGFQSNLHQLNHNFVLSSPGGQVVKAAKPNNRCGYVDRKQDIPILFVHLLEPGHDAQLFRWHRGLNQWLHLHRCLLWSFNRSYYLFFRFRAFHFIFGAIMVCVWFVRDLMLSSKGSCYCRSRSTHPVGIQHQLICARDIHRQYFVFGLGPTWESILGHPRTTRQVC